MKTVYGILTILGFIVLLLAGYTVYLDKRSPRIGYVHNGVFMEKYAGMQDAKKLLERKFEEWESNIDTLEMNYRKSLDLYNKNYADLKVSEREELKSSIDRQGEELEQYVSAIEKKVLDENQKLMQGVASQVNMFIKQYAEKNGYDLILGVSGNGNIVYGRDAIDLTEDILEALNEEYGER